MRSIRITIWSCYTGYTRYTVRRTTGLVINMVFRLINPSNFLTLAHWLETCVAQVRSSVIKTPRSLSADTVSIRDPFISYSKVTGLTFLVMRCALHLRELNCRVEMVDRCKIDARLHTSCWRSCVSHDDLIAFNSLVSFAIIATWLDWTASGSEFTQRRKSIGPSIEPCGTPDVTGRVPDVAPNAVTHWDRFHK